MSSYVITGSTRGIGLEFVKQLSSTPENKVFAIYRNKATAAQLEELKAKRSNVYLLEADVKDHKALAAAASEVSRITGGTLDVLINNVISVPVERHFLPLDTYPNADVLTTDILDSVHNNFIGVIHTINVFLPFIQAGRTKKIISISSAAVLPSFTVGMGDVGGVPYGIAKLGMNMAMLKYAVKYKSEGVIFLALSPGLVDTPRDNLTAEEQLQMRNGMIAAVRKVKPDFEGPLTTEESVKRQLDVIDNLKIENSGAFLSHYGNDTEWL